MTDLIAAAIATGNRRGGATWYSNCPQDVQDFLATNVVKPYWAAGMKPQVTALHKVARQAVIDKFGTDYLDIDPTTFARWLTKTQT